MRMNGDFVDGVAAVVVAEEADIVFFACSHCANRDNYGRYTGKTARKKHCLYGTRVFQVNMCIFSCFYRGQNQQSHANIHE